MNSGKINASRRKGNQDRSSSNIGIVPYEIKVGTIPKVTNVSIVPGFT